MSKLDFDPADVQSRKDIDDINSGKKRAVGDKDRLTNLLAQAAQTQSDVSPANHTPLKFLCVQFGKLQEEKVALEKNIHGMKELVIAMDPDTGRFANLPSIVAELLGYIYVTRSWAP